MPPRHGKSELTSHWLPVWYLDRFPDRSIIHTSYSSELSKSYGRAARDSILRHEESLRVRVSGRSAAAHRWATTAGGVMRASGVGGTITGTGGDLIIIDDPVKDIEEAYSSSRRDAIWAWYKAILYTRRAPHASIVLVMTRWHEDDLAGRLIRAGLRGEGDIWTEIRLPALAEEGDPLGRAPGEALWPGRYPSDDLERTRKILGPVFWSALYQQDPKPAGTRLFPRGAWKRYLVRPEPGWFDALLQSWDLAFKDLSSSSYVVGQVWGIKGGRMYLLDQVRDHLSFARTIGVMRATHKAWPGCGAKLVEDKANGPAVISHLEHEIPGLLAVEPGGSKEARAAAVHPFALAGNLWLPTEAPWLEEFLEELESFPGGRHDDQVDAASQAISHCLLEGRFYGDEIAIGGASQESPWSFVVRR